MTSPAQRYLLERGQFGTRAVITAPWHQDIQAQLLKAGITEIELNEGKGWRGDDLSFLEQFPNLRGFAILDLTIKSVEPIHTLHQLQTLKVLTYCRTELRFSEFPNLAECSIEWRDKATSLFTSRRLKKLFVNRFNGRDLQLFGQLTQLESLTILGASITSLRGIESLLHLRSLRLGALKKLESLKGIEKLTKLETLELNTCRKVFSISELSQLTHLRQLHLTNMDEIQTLEPVRHLPDLEWLTFAESTNILDGDLSPIVALPKLTRISFQNRRHYSHSREDFGVAYSGGTAGT